MAREGMNVFIADAHCDSLYALGVLGAHPEKLMVTAQRLEAGGVALQTYALFSGGSSDSGTPWTRAQKMLDMIPWLGVPLLRGPLPDAPPEGPHGILSIEGGEVLEGSFARLHHFHALGVKMIALTWNYENEIGYPAVGGSGKGLKPFGRELIAEMDALGMLCDVSHLNDAGIDEVLARAKLPVIASHSNARWVTETPRNLARAQVKEIARRRGFIGLNFYPKFLASGRDAVVEDVLRHLDALCEAGAEQCVGFGSDFDGIERWPEGLGGPEGFPALLRMIEAQGYDEKTVAGIAGLNLWGVLKQAEAG